MRHGALEHLQRPVRHVLLQTQHPQGRTALPSAVEGRGEHIEHHLFGQRRRIDHQRILAARFGDQRHGRAIGERASGQLLFDQPRDLGRASKHYPAYSFVSHQRRPDLAVARHQLQHVGGNAGGMDQVHGQLRDQRRFLGRLGDHRIARRQRCRNLAGENGQRKIPRRNAHHRPQRPMSIVGKAFFDLLAVIAQEIDGFSHFGNSVSRALARLAHGQRHKKLHPRFHGFRGPVQHGRPFGWRHPRPGRCYLVRPHHDRTDHVLGGLDHLADHVTMIGRIYDLARNSALLTGPGLPVAAKAVTQRPIEPAQRLLVGKVQSARIASPFRQNVPGQVDLLMERSERRNLPGPLHRVDNQALDRNVLIGDLVDEARIGSIFEQSPHQIRQNRLMAPDRRVYAAGPSELVLGHHLFVKRFAHAVQALEFIVADPELRPRQHIDRRHGLRVVRCKLRKHQVTRRQQLFRAGDIAHIGMDLPGEHRKIGLPIELGTLDLAVPIGALDQSHHDPVPRAARKIDYPIDHIEAALGIGLHDEADAVPAIELRIGRQRFEQIEREIKPVHFLGVDVEPDIIALGEPRQLLEPWQQLVHHAPILRPRIARMERGKLDRDARSSIRPALIGGLADGMDRPDIVGHVAVRIDSGDRGLPQHVIRIPEPPILPGFCVPERVPDGLAGDELLAQHAHRHPDAGPDHGLTRARNQPGESTRQPFFIDGRHQLAGHHQPPCRCVDEHRAIEPQMLLPIARRDLVGDQEVSGGIVRRTQQRFGQAHERNALLARKRIFIH